jgi:hypothetical protein
MFYAPVEPPKARFAKADPMAGLTSQSFVKLDRR